jgi:16S rRNA (guanine966-N2)-methyltransferase
MNEVRITAGSLRGRRIPVPRDRVRPTSERARQAYFNIVSARIEGARFLDLFAGSGIFSFEALSRGASAAVAVEESRKQSEAIAETAARLGANIEAIAGDAVTAVRRWNAEPFDLVYADPPYDYAAYDELLSALEDAPLAPEALVTVEHRRGTSPFKAAPTRLELWRRAEYGQVWMTFFKRPQHLQEGG